MVSTPETFIYVIPSLRKTPTTVKTQSASKPLCLFTNIFDVKKKTARRLIGASEYKHRAMKVGNSLWTNKTK